jgi:hypothetical protein
MARGTDWLNLASNVQQNRQLAAMKAQQEQQMMMSMMQEMNRQNIIEMRKLVLNLDQFADRAVAVSNLYPAYALMMTRIAIESIDSAGLDADTFEEITDMERVSQMNTKIRGNEASMISSASQDTISSAHQMRVFIEEGEDEMEALAPMCAANEDWAEHADEFAEVDPLHQERRGKYRMTGAPIIIGLILMGAAVGMSGECLVYDADGWCVTYENESFTIDALNGVGALLILIGIILMLALFPWSRKYLKQWSPLNDKKELVEEVEESWFHLSQKYGMTSSQDVNDRRQQMIAWVVKMTPTDPTMKLEM